MSVFSNRMSDAKQEAGAYTRAVLGLLGDRDPFQLGMGMPDILGRRLEQLAGAMQQQIVARFPQKRDPLEDLVLQRGPDPFRLGQLAA